MSYRFNVGDTVRCITSRPAHGAYLPGNEILVVFDHQGRENADVCVIRPNGVTQVCVDSDLARIKPRQQKKQPAAPSAPAEPAEDKALAYLKAELQQPAEQADHESLRHMLASVYGLKMVKRTVVEFEKVGQ